MIGGPRVGWIVHYRYVWAAEAEAGVEEGRKDRPCVLILATMDEVGRRMVRVLPVTHRPPKDASEAIEIPLKTKARLGLDGARSWIICGEGNRFAWPGPDLRRIPGRHPPTIWHGPLPPNLFAQVQARVGALARRRRHRDVLRTE